MIKKAHWLKFRSETLLLYASECGIPLGSALYAKIISIHHQCEGKINPSRGSLFGIMRLAE